jgi:hypothetical protein
MTETQVILILAVAVVEQFIILAQQLQAAMAVQVS